jgi:thiol-disulfide isomerase/thioredoxin
MKLFFCFLLCFCLNFRVWAQDISLTKGLAIGDVVPSSAGLDAYRGRLLILDFWATWCAPCRAMIPRTDSLNQAFERQLLILPVTYETEKLAGPVLYRLHRKGMAFPEVFRDTVLRKLFPHVSLPHYVWIDPNGVVRAITEAPVITAANIRLALSLGQYPRGQKNDLRIAYDPARPLFAGGNGGDGGQLRYHSMLAGYVPGLPPGLTVSRFDSIRGQIFSARNVPLLWLFRLAFHEKNRWFAFARIRNQSRDSAAMRSPGSGSIYEQWLASGSGYCYELQLPPSLARQAFPMIRADLDRLFPQYALSVEKIRTRCLALVRTGPDSLFRAKGKLPFRVAVSPYECKLQNAPLSVLIQRLEHQYLQLSKLPLSDETGYSGRADLAFSANMTRPADINRGLAPYGLALVEKDAETEMLVIRDRPVTP